MVISKSAARKPEARRIKEYWEENSDEYDCPLLEVLRLREVEDVDILWGLTKAMKERDSEGIQICGYLLGILEPLDRKRHLIDILGRSTA